MFLFWHSQNISVKNAAVLFIIPSDGKTSVYYAMQTLKVQLPHVVVKVGHRRDLECAIGTVWLKKKKKR